MSDNNTQKPGIQNQGPTRWQENYGKPPTTGIRINPKNTQPSGQPEHGAWLDKVQPHNDHPSGKGARNL